MILKVSIDKCKELKEALQEERNRLPEIGGFGNNNWEPLDDQLYILERVISSIPFNYEDLTDEENVEELVEWLKGGDNKSDFYMDYCG